MNILIHSLYNRVSPYWQQSQIRKVQIRKVQIRQGYKYGNKGGNKYGKANVTNPANDVTNPARPMLHIRQVMLQIRQQSLFRNSVQTENQNLVPLN